MAKLVEHWLIDPATMSLPQCQIIVYPYGNESVTPHMLDAVIDDTRGTNFVTHAAVKRLQDLDRWLVSSSGGADASVELQFQINKGTRIYAEKFTVSDKAPTGLPRGCGIVMGKNSSVHRDFYQQGYSGLPMVYIELTQEEKEQRARNEEQQKKQEAKYEEERKARVNERYNQQRNASRA